MPFLQTLPHLANWQPLPVGDEAPEVSLTAHDGTWIRSQDYKGTTHLVLVFFRSFDHDETNAYLQAVDDLTERLEALDTQVFGVNHNPTDRLSEYVSNQGHAFFVLYDTLALTARTYRCSGRLRPYCKPAVVVISKEGTIELAEHGYPSVDRVLECLATLEGVNVPAETSAEEAAQAPTANAEPVAITAPEAVAKLEATDSPYLLVDVRTKSEHDAYHPEGCIHIPVDDLPQRHAELKQEAHVILVCQTGDQSAAGAAFLTGIGFRDVFVVGEGMSGWTGAEGGGAA